MEFAAAISSPDPIEALAERVRQLMPSTGETISACIGGGMDKLLWLMETAGYAKLREAGLDFDVCHTVEGNEVLLVHTTSESALGAWGQLWRSEWEFAALPASSLAKLLRSLDVGIEHLALTARAAGRAA